MELIVIVKCHIPLNAFLTFFRWCCKSKGRKGSKGHRRSEKGVKHNFHIHNAPQKSSEINLTI